MTRRPLEPTRKEIAAWRRLLEEARACANNPSRPTGDLFARAASTAKACVPTGAEERANPWFQLRDTVILFCAKRGDRQRLAPDMAQRCEACLAQLETLPQSSPASDASLPKHPKPGRHAEARLGGGPPEPCTTLRFRADLDG